MDVRIIGLRGVPEIQPGDDIAARLRDAARRQNQALAADTIVAVAQKIVSKAEGAVVDLRTIEPSAFAAQWAREWGKDPRLIELVLRQARRIVKMDRGVLVAETHHGLVAANAGVDQSNVAGEHAATILPPDPDASARRIRTGLGCGAVIITDTFGRPWREGLVNVAIGVSGLEAVEDLRGTMDASGRSLQATVIALADELAAAAGLVMRKDAGIPAALIFGALWRAAEGSGRTLIRDPQRDLFR